MDEKNAIEQINKMAIELAEITKKYIDLPGAIITKNKLQLKSVSDALQSICKDINDQLKRIDF